MAAVAVTSLVGAKYAHATDLVWNGSADVSWSNPLNWTPNSAPTATNDTMTFNNSGEAALANTVDAGLTGFTFAKLTYSQDNSSFDAQGNAVNAYTTSIDRGVTLTLAQAASGTSPAPS